MMMMLLSVPRSNEGKSLEQPGHGKRQHAQGAKEGEECVSNYPPLDQNDVLFRHLCPSYKYRVHAWSGNIVKNFCFLYSTDINVPTFIWRRDIHANLFPEFVMIRWQYPARSRSGIADIITIEVCSI